MGFGVWWGHVVSDEEQGEKVGKYMHVYVQGYRFMPVIVSMWEKSVLYTYSGYAEISLFHWCSFNIILCSLEN